MSEDEGSKLKNIFDQARRLAPVDRAELLERLFGTFETKNQSEIDAAWASEAEDRLASYRSGDL